MAWFANALAVHKVDVPPTFVETGAYLGDGIRSILQSRLFETIHSIELSPQWVNHCRRRFSRYRAVHIHEGDSANVLQTLELPKQPVLFYLDAHYSGGPTAGEDIDNGCPVLRELMCIANRGVPGDVIFVDDMRLMGKDQESGVKDHAVYPLTRFDFRHAHEDAMRECFRGRSIRVWANCEDIDRLLIVLD
jgi:hypothetical protein